MKKAMALLVALAAIFAINGGAFAAVGTEFARGMEWANDHTDSNPRINVEKNQLVLGYSANGGYNVVLPETFLQPGNEYTYQLLRVDETNTSAAPNDVKVTVVNDNVLGNAKLRIRTVKGSGNVVTAKIDKKGTGANAVYNFKIETKETYGTKVNDLEYNIVVSGQAAGATDRLLDANIMFQTGYRAMLDEDIDYYSEGDTVTISDERPVITKDQFESLAKNFNYKPVEFTGEEGDWIFSGRVSGMSDTNFLTDYDVVPDIINAFPDQDYKFLTFNAGVSFPTNGEMRIDVSDIREDATGAKLYTYLYRNGTLTPITTTYDSTSDEIVFRTNYLGAFVVTTSEITDLEEGETPDEGNGGDESGENPPTGAASAMGVAALGIASLAAGLVRKNRKSK